VNGDDLPDWVTAFDDGDTPVRFTKLNTGERFVSRD
jgi:hypothetical protein